MEAFKTQLDRVLGQPALADPAQAEGLGYTISSSPNLNYAGIPKFFMASTKAQTEEESLQKLAFFAQTTNSKLQIYLH